MLSAALFPHSMSMEDEATLLRTEEMADGMVRRSSRRCSIDDSSSMKNILTHRGGMISSDAAAAADMEAVGLRSLKRGQHVRGNSSEAAARIQPPLDAAIPHEPQNRWADEKTKKPLRKRLEASSKENQQGSDVWKLQPDIPGVASSLHHEAANAAAAAEAERLQLVGRRFWSGAAGKASDLFEVKPAAAESSRSLSPLASHRAWQYHANAGLEPSRRSSRRRSSSSSTTLRSQLKGPGAMLDESLGEL
jgi:hypothetical protein